MNMLARKKAEARAADAPRPPPAQGPPPFKLAPPKNKWNSTGRSIMLMKVAATQFHSNIEKEREMRKAAHAEFDELMERALELHQQEQQAARERQQRRQEMRARLADDVHAARQHAMKAAWEAGRQLRGLRRVAAANGRCESDMQALEARLVPRVTEIRRAKAAERRAATEGEDDGLSQHERAINQNYIAIKERIIGRAHASAKRMEVPETEPVHPPACEDGDLDPVDVTVEDGREVAGGTLENDQQAVKETPPTKPVQPKLALEERMRNRTRTHKVWSPAGGVAKPNAAGSSNKTVTPLVPQFGAGVRVSWAVDAAGPFSASTSQAPARKIARVKPQVPAEVASVVPRPQGGIQGAQSGGVPGSHTGIQRAQSGGVPGAHTEGVPGAQSGIQGAQSGSQAPAAAGPEAEVVPAPEERTEDASLDSIRIDNSQQQLVPDAALANTPATEACAVGPRSADEATQSEPALAPSGADDDDANISISTLDGVFRGASIHEHATPVASPSSVGAREEESGGDQEPCGDEEGSSYLQKVREEAARIAHRQKSLEQEEASSPRGQDGWSPEHQRPETPTSSSERPGGAFLPVAGAANSPRCHRGTPEALRASGRLPLEQDDANGERPMSALQMLNCMRQLLEDEDMPWADEAEWISERKQAIQFELLDYDYSLNRFPGKKLRPRRGHLPSGQIGLSQVPLIEPQPKATLSQYPPAFLSPAKAAHSGFSPKNHTRILPDHLAQVRASVSDPHVVQFHSPSSPLSKPAPTPPGSGSKGLRRRASDGGLRSISGGEAHSPRRNAGVEEGAVDGKVLASLAHPLGSKKPHHTLRALTDLQIPSEGELRSTNKATSVQRRTEIRDAHNPQTILTPEEVARLRRNKGRRHSMDNKSGFAMEASPSSALPPKQLDWFLHPRHVSKSSQSSNSNESLYQGTRSMPSRIRYSDGSTGHNALGVQGGSTTAHLRRAQSYCTVPEDDASPNRISSDPIYTRPKPKHVLSKPTLPQLDRGRYGASRVAHTSRGMASSPLKPCDDTGARQSRRWSSNDTALPEIVSQSPRHYTNTAPEDARLAMNGSAPSLPEVSGKSRRLSG